MNYLAHAYLSPDDPEVLMGNLWGDLLKPRDYEILTPGILKGIIRHKMIDAFTDAHDHVSRLKTLILPFQKKYTPVVADVLMDFILSKHWNSLHDQSIESFCAVRYGIVKDHVHLIPERLHPRINRMLENQWLESCKNRERMEIALRMLSRRASFENKIPETMQVYDTYEEEMDLLFLTFFENLTAHITLQSESLS